MATIDKISTEKILHANDDFNINLLKFESHTLTDEFINTMTAYCFQPHIIQPTKIQSRINQWAHWASAQGPKKEWLN